jgi:hypothetical protein
VSIDLPAPNVSVANVLDAQGVQANFEVLSTKLTAGAGAPTFVSSLPVSPVDGQEIYYQSTTAGTGGGATNSMATVGAVWHLRYNASASGSYKWQVLGGAPTTHLGVGGRTVGVWESAPTTLAFGDLATPGPTIIAPLAGEYLVEGSAMCQSSTTSGELFIWQTGVTPPTWYYADAIGFVGSVWYSTLTAKRTVTVAAGDNVRLYYAVSNFGALCYFWNRNLTLTPIRLG